MGNCINGGHVQNSWVDYGYDDWEWDSPSSSPEPAPATLKESPHAKEGKDGKKAEQPPANEVKIKITKKQLEELLKKVDGQELPLQQLLRQLVAVRDSRLLGGDAGRHWRPALKSIPEATE